MTEIVVRKNEFSGQHVTLDLILAWWIKQLSFLDNGEKL